VLIIDLPRNVLIALITVAGENAAANIDHALPAVLLLVLFFRGSYVILRQVHLPAEIVVIVVLTLLFCLSLRSIVKLRLACVH
jgi:hypothetical protein